VLPGDGGGNSAARDSIRALAPTTGLRRDFIWGVSTSSFQIEGATREDGRGPSVWDTRGQQGLIANHDTGDIACDHYHRYPKDIALMQRLGVQAYRFSVAWPRVLPHGRGAPNEPGLAFYDRLIDAILAAGIEPWLCLYHWDMPQAIDDLGGWTVRDSVGWFADYTALIANRYGDRVKRFATFNEPSIFTLFGHGFGDGENPVNADRMHRAIHHVNLAHGAAVDVLRTRVPASSIGCIHNYQPCLPSTPSDTLAAKLCDAYWNRVYPDPQCHGDYPPLLRAAIEPHMQPGDLARIQRPLDWFGLNHYGPSYFKADAGARFVIVGHSERRADHGESDGLVLAKARAALAAGLTPIVCVGETRSEREGGKAESVVAAQIAGSVPPEAPPDDETPVADGVPPSLAPAPLAAGDGQMSLF